MAESKINGCELIVLLFTQVVQRPTHSDADSSCAAAHTVYRDTSKEC